MPIKQLMIAAAMCVGATSASALTTIFEDNFDRSNSDTVGNGWGELQMNSNDVKVFDHVLWLRNDRDPNNPDAAVSQTIDATGYTDLTISFSWLTFGGTELPSVALAGDQMNFSYTLDVGKDMRDETNWDLLASYPGGTDDVWNTATLSFGSAVDDSVFDIMFWTQVTDPNEGFKLDNIVVTGTAMTPVPLPAGGALLLGALGGLGFAARRRRKLRV